MEPGLKTILEGDRGDVEACSKVLAPYSLIIDSEISHRYDLA
jgi:hypothetical protein